MSAITSLVLSLSCLISSSAVQYSTYRAKFNVAFQDPLWSGSNRTRGQPYGRMGLMSEGLGHVWELPPGTIKTFDQVSHYKFNKLVNLSLDESLSSTTVSLFLDMWDDNQVSKVNHIITNVVTINLEKAGSDWMIKRDYTQAEVLWPCSSTEVTAHGLFSAFTLAGLSPQPRSTFAIITSKDDICEFDTSVPRISKIDCNNLCASKPDGFYVNPCDADCRSFVTCSSANAQIQECQSGLIYNPNNGACDWPSSHICDPAAE